MQVLSAGKSQLSLKLMMVLAVIFPLLPLFSLNAQSNLDWSTHISTIAYFGEYIRHHGSAPWTLNWDRLVGDPRPIFYGYLFYPTVGLLSAVFGANLALRIALLLLSGLQVITVSATTRRIGGSPWLSLMLACLMNWAIYPMTNLYNRAALTEYFATTLLTCAICYGVRIFVEPVGPARRLALSLFLLYFTLSAGTHPITAVLGLPFVAIVLIAAAWTQGKDANPSTLIRPSIAVLWTLPVLVLLPWTYLAVKFSGLLYVTRVYPHVTFISGIDTWWVRLMPFPLDLRALYEGTSPGRVATPHLDAQVSLPLLISAIVILRPWKLRERLRPGARARIAATVFLFLGFYAYLASVYPYYFALLPKQFELVQFAYRFATYTNVGWFTAVLFGLLAYYRPAHPAKALESSSLAILVPVCFTIAGMALLLKLIHATTVMDFNHSRPELKIAAENREGLLVVPYHYSLHDYMTYINACSDKPEFTKIQDWTAVPRFALDFGANWSAALPMELAASSTSSTSRFISTDIYPFSWNQLWMDGAPVPTADTCYDSYQMVAKVPAGPHHLEWHFMPDMLWVFARTISLWVLCFWVALTVWLQRKNLLLRSPND